MHSLYFGKEVKSLTSSDRKLQILGPSVLTLFSLKVVVFALLLIESFLNTVLVTYKKFTFM